MFPHKASRWILRTGLVKNSTRTLASTTANLPLLKHQAYINGKYVDAKNADTFDVFNPASGEKIGAVANIGCEQVKDAINVAHDAFKTWKKTTPKERSLILRKWYELIIKNQDELATILTMENGKTLAESVMEIQYAASFVDWYAAEARRIQGEVLASPDQRRILTLKQPAGVVGIITPWNFPTAMITRKIAPALAAGCTCVSRPAEDTPYSALAMGQLASEAGIPDGVVNFVPSSRHEASPVGKLMCESPLVSVISFTGSSQVGKILLSQSAGTVKRVCLELGGNAPFIVFDSANLDLAVQCFMYAKFRGAGQTCVSANRILVQSGVYDQFIDKLSEKMKSSLKLGNGLESGVTQGPLINNSAIQKVDGLVQDAVKRGARVVLGGSIKSGLFYEPTLLCDIQSDMTCASEEIFGPVAAIRRFNTESEAISLANDCRVGLAGYVYTGDMSQAWRMAEELEVGMVAVNNSSVSGAEIPFGGVKESGLGRESSHYGIDEFLEVKSVTFGGI